MCAPHCRAWEHGRPPRNDTRAYAGERGGDEGLVLAGGALGRALLKRGGGPVAELRDGTDHIEGFAALRLFAAHATHVLEISYLFSCCWRGPVAGEESGEGR